MAAITWPVAPFPQQPDIRGFSHGATPQSERFETDLGPPLVRRLTHSQLERYTTTWILDLSERDQLMDFWKNRVDGSPAGCDGGSAEFDIQRPGDPSTTVEALMTEPREVASNSGVRFAISFDIIEVAIL